MLSPNNIELKENVYLKLTKFFGDKVKYGLFSKNGTEYGLLKDFVSSKVDKQLDFSETYFVKNSTIPRSKFREYGKNQNWKIVRNPDTASSIIIPNDYFDLEHIYYYQTSIYVDPQLAKDILDKNSAFINFLTTYKHTYSVVNKVLKENMSNTRNSLLEQINTIPQNVEVVQLRLICDYNQRKTFYIEWSALIAQNKFKIYSSCSGEISTEIIDHFYKYADKLVYDTTIASKLGDTTIGINEWKSIEAMMDSGQTDNANLAVSIITQSNYDSSKLYLALFLYKYNHKVADLPCYNLKDYKALRSYFKEYGNVKHWVLRTFVQIVKDHSHLIDFDFSTILDDTMLKYVVMQTYPMKDCLDITSVKFKYD